MSQTALQAEMALPVGIYKMLHPEKKRRKHVVCKWKNCPLYSATGCTIDSHGVGKCDVFTAAVAELIKQNYIVYADVLECAHCGAENGSHTKASCPNRFTIGGAFR